MVNGNIRKKTKFLPFRFSKAFGKNLFNITKTRRDSYTIYCLYYFLSIRNLIFLFDLGFLCSQMKQSQPRVGKRESQ